MDLTQRGFSGAFLSAWFFNAACEIKRALADNFAHSKLTLRGLAVPNCRRKLFTVDFVDHLRGDVPGVLV
ncbi:MAG: hypothetical protein OEN23_20845 [Paracoccaceae bacterium]|nr:hypothetical protein [Paracoccaceae bacterium]